MFTDKIIYGFLYEKPQIKRLRMKNARNSAILIERPAPTPYIGALEAWGIDCKPNPEFNLKAPASIIIGKKA